jgi:hypothetical protein
MEAVGYRSHLGKRGVRQTMNSRHRIPCFTPHSVRHGPEKIVHWFQADFDTCQRLPRACVQFARDPPSFPLDFFYQRVA